MFMVFYFLWRLQTGQFCCLCMVFGKWFFSYSCGRPHVRLVNLFLSMINKEFLHLFGCLMLHCFRDVFLIYCSVIETKEVQRLIVKVAQITCLFSCKFYFLWNLWTLCALAKNKAMYKYIDLTVEAYEEYFEGWGSPSEFNYGHLLWYSRGKGRPKSDGCRCERRGGQSSSLWGRGHKWLTPKCKDFRKPCKDCMYQSYLRLVLYRFQIDPLLLVYKLYCFLLLFWIQ